MSTAPTPIPTAHALPSYLLATGAVITERNGTHHIHVRHASTNKAGYAFIGDLRCAVQRETAGRAPLNFSGLLRTKAQVERLDGMG